MKKINYKIKLHFSILYIILIISILINIIANKNIIIGNQTQIIKTMDETTEVTNLNNTINALQESHKEYSNYIQTSKINLATAITNAGVSTNEDDTFETMISNISNILSNNSYGKKIGTYSYIITSPTVKTIDCTSIPNYSNLTVDNFVIGMNSIVRAENGNYLWESVYTSTFTKSYDNSTGILSITFNPNTSGYGGYQYTWTYNFDLFAIK